MGVPGGRGELFACNRNCSGQKIGLWEDKAGSEGQAAVRLEQVASGQSDGRSQSTGALVEEGLVRGPSPILEPAEVFKERNSFDAL